MALASRNRRAKKVKEEPPQLKLRFKRLFYIGLIVVVFAPLVGFLPLQRDLPKFPSPLSEPDRRGSIVASDGTVFAEGGVDNRVYPQGALAAHVVGFSGKRQDPKATNDAYHSEDYYGLEGIEYVMESRLMAGETITLTLDPTIQAVVQAELSQAARNFEAESGAAVILEAGTGRILAVASYPEFDPNSQSQLTGAERSAIRNRAFLQQVEPGSTIKPFVIAALLESGRLSPLERLSTDMTMRVGDQTFRDVAQHGPLLEVKDVLRYSSNVGMIQLGQRFSSQELHAWLQHFGFGRDVGLRYSFTRKGRLNPWQRWVPQDHASMSIGQSLTTTSLQLAGAYSVFANDGLYYYPRIVEDAPWDTPERILSPDVARAVRSMMVHVVENSGVRRAKIPGVSVAGKTGTADSYNVTEQRYIDGEYTLHFAGMFPAENPRVTAVIFLDKPKLGDSSTYVVTPIFRRIGSEVVALLDIPTGDPYGSVVNASIANLGEQ